ncbi:MAG: N-(5'-phosphoribosyl)anthranilate isomerase [Flavobacteriales bacterium]|nr:N-(5'-phosphoribosyl)anthranilate isomerase [Flavobacteriales bacterium]
MKHQSNVDEIIPLGLDFIGNIFFEDSPRNINSYVSTTTKKVGVFVKESISIIRKKIKKHSLDVVQLHGGESNEFCKTIKDMGVEVWKVISIESYHDISILKDFPDADLFLFDTKTVKHGGAGKKFDWKLLGKIDKETTKQYFLAGGIGPNDAEEIKELKLQNLIGLDLNSKFEISPGIKNPESLKVFLKQLRS